MLAHIMENGAIDFEPTIANRLVNEISSKIREALDRDFIPVLGCLEPLRYGVKFFLNSMRVSGIHVISDKEIDVAIRKMNISVHNFESIGEDFVPTAEKESEPVLILIQLIYLFLIMQKT